MKKLAIAAFALLSTSIHAEDSMLPHSPPEAQGIPSAAVKAFIEAAEDSIDALHSLVLVRHGHVVARGGWAPYGPDTPHRLYSLSKSFTSSAIGLAQEEGLLSIDDLVLPYFADQASATPDANLALMRIRDLLSMTTGHNDDTLDAFFGREDGRWTQAFLELPVPHKPGTHFVYNTGATYMLSAILQKVTGQTVLDYLKPRLFEPLGIADPQWPTSPEGIILGGWGLSITAEGIARFGQLYLQEGMWQGRRLLPAAWIAQATARQSSNGSNPVSDWEQGYGFQFWRCRHGAYRGDGAFGQYCIVMPKQKAVLAMTGGLSDMQAVLDLVWLHLLPAMEKAPLPADPPTHRALEDKLATLALPPQGGDASSPWAAKISGKRYTFAANDDDLKAVSIDFTAQAPVVTIVDDGGTHTLVCGQGAWHKGVATYDENRSQNVAVSAAWTDADTYTVQMCLYETPFICTFRFRFGPDQVQYSRSYNVSFGPTDGPLLVGQLSP